MIGERENIYSDKNYGILTMRAFDIDGNKINAFYDAEDNLVFVLDNTINAQKPNVLLVIDSQGDKKWDEILTSDYDVDLETIRPKVDNKYQKLDIEYSGLPVYENLINAYNAGGDLSEQLNRLAVLRDSATRHSAMMRLNVANETISKTNTTIVKTKETIVRLEARIKTLRSNLSSEKKKIGKVNTKQSASKILKLESQIEATNEKLKRAKKRLDSAQKRLEIATVDAELASALLNQPAIEIKESMKSKPVMVAPKYPVQKTDGKEEPNSFDDEEDIADEEFDEVIESDVKPLFSEDPQILNDNIAFKPIEFNTPVFQDIKQEVAAPVVESVPVAEKEPDLESRPVLESFKPIEVPAFVPEQITEEKSEITESVEERPVLETIVPVSQELNVEPVEQPVITEEKTEITEEHPVLDTIVPVPQDFDIEPTEQLKTEESTDVTETSTEPVAPVEPITPIINTFQTPVEVKSEHSKPGFIYYVLLLILICLSVFTLWLYQRNMTTDTAPVLTASAPETTVMQPKQKTMEQVAKPDVDKTEPVFLDEETEDHKAVAEDKIVADEPEEEIEYDEEEIDEAPVVIDAVPGRLNTSGIDEDEETTMISEEDILASKPVFEPGAKHDNMFVNKENSTESVLEEPGFVEPEEYDEYDDYFFDEEEAAYQAEMQQ